MMVGAMVKSAMESSDCRLLAPRSTTCAGLGVSRHGLARGPRAAAPGRRCAAARGSRRGARAHLEDLARLALEVKVERKGMEVREDAQLDALARVLSRWRR
jgi:hypothetical protein